METQLLTHFGKKRVTELEDTRHKVGEFYIKPVGIWLSDETCEASWSRWCEAEEFPRGPISTDFIVDLTDVLVCDGLQSLLKTKEKYGKEDRWKPLDWVKMSKDYKGIYIPNYVRHWQTNIGIWYYAWDCSSACVWDPTCLTLTGENQ